MNLTELGIKEKGENQKIEQEQVAKIGEAE